MKNVTKHKHHRGIFEYLIAYDYNAGSPNRYTVLILNVDDPVTVGRELHLSEVRELIADYEKEAAKLPCWTGGRRDVLACLKRVSQMRLLGPKEAERSTKCPHCGASPGKPCRGSDGYPLAKNHAGR
jgi:hypothetical protein